MRCLIPAQQLGIETARHFPAEQFVKNVHRAPQSSFRGSEVRDQSGFIVRAEVSFPLKAALRFVQKREPLVQRLFTTPIEGPCHRSPVATRHQNSYRAKGVV